MGDTVDGPPHQASRHAPGPASPQPTTIGRFQVTTNTEARVGRFSVSRAQDEAVELGLGQTPAAQVNGPSSPCGSPELRASLPSLNNSYNSYISSDNDSEFEDEDFRREISHLREK